MSRGITKGVEDSVANADKQTRDTREIFSVPNAVGMLIILNESALTLHPDLIRYGLSPLFQKKSADGSLRYPHNNDVIVISEAHALISRGMPCFSATSPHGIGKEAVSEFSDALIHSWAGFNNLPVLPV
jgi:hypothetical protein